MQIAEQKEDHHAVYVGGGTLTIGQVVEVARFHAKVELREESICCMAKSRAYVESLLREKKWCTA